LTKVLQYNIILTMNISTVTTKGQATIPEEIRRLLNINIGDKVSFTTIEPHTKQIMIKIIPSNVVDQLVGSLSSKVKYVDFKEVRKIAGKLLVKKYKIK